MAIVKNSVVRSDVNKFGIVFVKRLSSVDIGGVKLLLLSVGNSVVE